MDQTTTLADHELNETNKIIQMLNGGIFYG